MHRRQLSEELQRYRDTWAQGFLSYQNIDLQGERQQVQDFLSFADRQAKCFERDCFDPGHFTASALIINPKVDRVLLTLHAKLGKWIQLGGHADGSSDLPGVATREVEEESGLSTFNFANMNRLFGLNSHSKTPIPFAIDLDRHLIPQRKKDPEHFHFDVCYLIVADDQLPLKISEESHDLRWLGLKEALSLTDDPSMRRKFAKLRALKGNLINWST